MITSFDILYKNHHSPKIERKISNLLQLQGILPRGLWLVMNLQTLKLLDLRRTFCCSFRGNLGRIVELW